MVTPSLNERLEAIRQKHQGLIGEARLKAVRIEQLRAELGRLMADESPDARNGFSGRPEHAAVAAMRREMQEAFNEWRDSVSPYPECQQP